MQLLLMLVLLLYGGNGKLLKEFGPLLQSVGGEDIKNVLKEAEEINSVLSAFKNGAGGEKGGKGAQDEEPFGGSQTDNTPPSADEEEGAQAGGASQDNCENGDITEDGCKGGQFPLAPIAGIADREILYRLVQYFSSAGA